MAQFSKKEKCKMKKTFKTVLCTMLTVTLSIGLLTGCSGNPSINTNGTTQSQSNGTDIQNQTNNILNGSENTSQKSCIYTNNGKVYYFPKNTFLLNDDNTVSIPTVNFISDKKSGTDSKNREFYIGNPDKCAIDGNKIYNQYKDDGTHIYVYSINGDNITEKVLMDSDILENCLGEYYYLIVQRMTDLYADSDYVYFKYDPERETFYETQKENYRLGRFKKDGSSIEILDEIASDIAIKDGWIYYYDNGYTYNEKATTNKKYSFDLSRAGIYKMKTDGSEKQLLLGNFKNYDEEKNSKYYLCDGITIYNNYIYFQNFTDEGESKVYRMNLDGSDLKAITKEGSYNYTVSGDTLYYSTGKRGENQTDPRSFIKVSLNDGNEEKLFNVFSSYLIFTVYDGYIYFNNVYDYYHSDIEQGSNTKPHCSGQRYNIIENKIENLYGYQLVKITEKDDFGMEEREYIGEPQYYWKDANKTEIIIDNRTVDDEFSLPKTE